MNLSTRQRIIFFVLLTFALSSIFYVRIASAGKLRMGTTFGLMWCPGVAATIVRLVTQRNLRGTGWKWGATQWQAISYLIPPAVCLVVYGLVWLTGIGSLTTAGIRAGVPLSVPAILTIYSTLGMIQAAIFAMGEEIGWRGFLVPELSLVSSFTMTALISGVIWSAFHYPLILFADYNAGTPKWFGLLAFTWMVVAHSFIFAWLRLKSGSVWTGVILHASHNLFVQNIFDPLTKNGDSAKYVTSEFGVGLAFVYTLVAIYFWTRRGELATSTKILPV